MDFIALVPGTNAAVVATEEGKKLSRDILQEEHYLHRTASRVLHVGVQYCIWCYNQSFNKVHELSALSLVQPFGFLRRFLLLYRRLFVVDIVYFREMNGMVRRLGPSSALFKEIPYVPRSAMSQTKSTSQPLSGLN